MQNPELFRDLNPFKNQLSQSICIFKLIVQDFGGYLSIPKSEIMNIFAGVGGEISFSEHEILLKATHAAIDAYGCLFVLTHLLENNPHVKLAKQPWEIKNGDNFGFLWQQINWQNSPPKNLGMTATQMFLRRFQVLLSNEIGKFGITVSIDSLTSISSESFLGNSLCIIPFSKDLEKSACFGDRKRWNDHINRIKSLVRRSVTLDIASNQGESCMLNVFSSCGSMSNLPWCHKFSPYNLIMMPTPPKSEGVNIILWGDGETTSLVICSGEAKKTELALQILAKLKGENL